MLTRMVSISWPRDPPASASQSAGITGLSHRARPYTVFFKSCSFCVGPRIREGCAPDRPSLSCPFLSTGIQQEQWRLKGRWQVEMLLEFLAGSHTWITVQTLKILEQSHTILVDNYSAFGKKHLSCYWALAESECLPMASNLLWNLATGQDLARCVWPTS